MREPAREAAAEIAPERGQAQPLQAPQVERILALQRSAGNRAVARLAATQTLARDTETVNEYVHETTTNTDDVSWWANFDVDFDEDRKTLWATIKIKLNPEGDIKKDDIDYTKIGVLSRFSLLWDSKFIFHEKKSWYASDVDWLFRPGIKFVDSGQHLSVALKKGKGKTNRQTWYLTLPEYNEDKSKEVPVGYAELEHAHEVSHQMGLLDEYEDVSVPDREVHKDHSLMGDYANEGFREAIVKPRHGERMAKLIGKATGRNLTSRTN